MCANPSVLTELTEAYAGPELIPFVCATPPVGKQADCPPVSGAESLNVAKGLLTAIDFEVTSIDFEVAAALSLCGGWHAQSQGDVYLIRTLERISEHMKALLAIQERLNQPAESNSISLLHAVAR